LAQDVSGELKNTSKKKFPGVVTTVGYAGGQKDQPTYRQVCSGSTGHAEVVQIEFDSGVYTFEKLCEYFFSIHDPTTLNRQGNDTGSQYRSVIFFHSPQQEQIAQSVKERTEERKEIFGKNVVTEISAFTNFFPAEDYHQDYLDVNPDGYCNHHERWKIN